LQFELTGLPIVMPDGLLVDGKTDPEETAAPAGTP